MRKTPTDPLQSSLLRRARSGGTGELHQPSAHRFQFRRFEDHDHVQGEGRVCDEALGPLRIGGLAWRVLWFHRAYRVE